MVSVLDSGAVDHGFELLSVQTNDQNIGVYYFYAKHAAIQSKSK
jgi:hypothetical protein